MSTHSGPSAPTPRTAVLLEPLNCYEAYPGVLTTIDETLHIIEETAFDNVGVQPDVFHMNVSEASIPDAIRAAGSHVKHFHMNETNHREHGSGHAGYTAIIRALKDIDYAGYLAFYLPFTTQEIFNLAAHGYGASGPDTGTVRRPDLRSHLDPPLQLFKELEARG